MVGTYNSFAKQSGRFLPAISKTIFGFTEKELAKLKVHDKNRFVLSKQTI